MFNALVLDKSDAGVSATLRTLDEAQLPEGEVLLAVSHSTLNYKDGLAIYQQGPGGAGLADGARHRWCGHCARKQPSRLEAW